MTDSLHPLTETVASIVGTAGADLPLNPLYRSQCLAIAETLLASPFIQQVAAQAWNQGVEHEWDGQTHFAGDTPTDFTDNPYTVGGADPFDVLKAEWQAEALETAADDLAQHVKVPVGVIQNMQAVYDLGPKTANAHGAVPWLRARAAELRASGTRGES